ncbi:uncharacterized protein B0I36DRAFT_433934 [Microdochium trichocladiopsis]|uniref:Zinc finger PHD-type domain-containing protein n=1 Tax=Microdochium trichocladiopsis TaxID=1682393 RepID=A0A9P8Y107_9PEZI|nr:uncharacterized protein B0I36DRAFT_433934 [Microdochium trichocladiopsis]KAH7026511.1 hypothetical protein B0I36DRAFT_433934 [Microdochium trichocladiopsis]
MVISRKRTRRDAELDAEPATKAPAVKEEPSMLQKIRNTWHFANLYQWICLFGKVVKIDDSLDVDDLEAELLKHRSGVLVDIGVALLKWVSSHRGLGPELFDEYTRRQYVAKAPELNPFGVEEEPAHFHDFDAFTKLRVLQQLTRWVMLHPERVREKMDEQRPSDQTEWRIEPTGWDSDDRTYFILDDNRLYRMTDAPPPSSATWKPKKNTQKAKAAARAAKRRRTSRSAAAQDDDDVDDDAPMSDAPTDAAVEPQDDGLGGAKWECVAANLDEVRSFLDSIRKSRDENEKVLRKSIEDHLLPILEKQEESRKRKILAKERELLALEKMAHAKRSSRLAGKVEQQRMESQRKEEEEKRKVEEEKQRKEELARIKMEKERDNRLMSRERRLQEREERRLQHEKELAQLSEDSKSLSGDNARLSERRLKAEIDKNRKALQELDEEEEDWIFDCACGVYGQIDDGTHSVACERCNVWQHSSCLGIKEEDAERDDFHFICSTCQRVSKSPAKDVKPTTIKLKVKGPETAANQELAPEPQRSKLQVEISSKLHSKPDLAPSSQAATATTNPQIAASNQPASQTTIPVKAAAPPSLPPPPSPHINGDGHHAFSSPHPALSPPDQSPNKARVYSRVYNNSSSPGPADQKPKEVKAPVKGIFHLSPKPNGISVPFLGSSPKLPKESLTSGKESPVKKSTESFSSVAPVLTPQAASFSSATTTVVSPSASFSTPQLKTSQGSVPSPVLTPKMSHAQNGISPLKRSPPPPAPISAQKTSAGSFHSTPATSILPPSTALSPSPAQTILTPPVKPADPVRPASQQSIGSSFDKL